MLDLFSQYTNISDSENEDETTWDAAHKVLTDRSKVEQMRGLCPQCARPLKRLARLPVYSVLLKCASSKQCSRCSDSILPGEMHYTCRECEETKICRSCGPGVYIERTYDYVDSCTGEINVRSVPQNVLHDRKQRQRLNSGRRTRGGVFATLHDTAGRIVASAKQLGDRFANSHEELYDREWSDPSLLSTLTGMQELEDIADALIQLAKAVEGILAKQPTMTEAKVPCKIFGDTHGQLRDVLILFHTFGLPGTADCPSAVFNGDFVDRGHHQVELIAVLFALKLLFPESVYLNRGNHEDRSMNERYGFKNACELTLGKQKGRDFFDAAEEAFAQLPLATLVGKKVLALHGGIGGGNWSIKELQDVKRPLFHRDLQSSDWLWNILWSDPIEDDSSMESRKVFGAHPSPRSRTAVKFGWDVTQRFCAMNNLCLIVRSHQAKKQGLGFDVMHNEMLVRVFSARDYEANCNDGAVLHITEDRDHPGMLSLRAQVLASLSEKW